MAITEARPEARPRSPLKARHTHQDPLLPTALPHPSAGVQPPPLTPPAHGLLSPGPRGRFVPAAPPTFLQVLLPGGTVQPVSRAAFSLKASLYLFLMLVVFFTSSEFSGWVLPPSLPAPRSFCCLPVLELCACSWLLVPSTAHPASRPFSSATCSQGSCGCSTVCGCEKRGCWLGGQTGRWLTGGWLSDPGPTVHGVPLSKAAWPLKPLNCASSPLLTFFFSSVF